MAKARETLAAQSQSLADLTTARSRLADERDGHAQELTQLKAQLTQIAALNASLINESKRLQTDLAAASTAAAQVPDLQQALNEREANAQALARQQQALQQDFARRLDAADRTASARIASLQQENQALTVRLRQAQGTLEQIAAAAQLINPGARTGTSSYSPATTTVAASAPATPTAAPRIHLVEEGDTLTRISLRYYGPPRRWQEVFEANRDVLGTENALRPGQRLSIP